VFYSEDEVIGLWNYNFTLLCSFLPLQSTSSI
jgi:hypothetical protein